MQPSAAGAGALATDEKDRRNTMVRTFWLLSSHYEQACRVFTAIAGFTEFADLSYYMCSFVLP